jgi:peptidoglycan/LPS O-acetylase OafA/YrhL
LLFAWIASTAYPNNGIDGLSTFFGRFTVVHLEFRELLRFMLFPGDAALQLPVGWTLGVEMLFSLLMPLMVLVASRTHWSVLLVGSSGLLFAYPLPGSYLRYAIAFAFGIAIFRERSRLATPITRTLALPAWIGALALLTTPVLIGAESVRDGIVLSGFRSWEIGVMVVGAAGILVLCLRAGTASQLLSSRICVFLGRISYSVYLVHFTVLLLAARLLNEPAGPLRAFVFASFVVAVTIALATTAHRLIELPAIRAGNALCRRVARFLAAPERPSRLAPP